MNKDSIWKKMMLLTLGSIFAFHIQVVEATDDSEGTKSTSGDEECVITDDQYLRIN